MPDSCRALAVSLEEDLLPLSTLLHQRGVRHRIFEEGGRQVLEVIQAEQVGEVRELYSAWRSGDVSIELRKRRPSKQVASPGVWRRSPVTMTLICLSILGFLVMNLRPLHGLAAQLTFALPPQAGTGTIDPVSAGHYWRLITPAFLHFSWLHIVFNCLWMWELGRKVEQVVGFLNTLFLFLVIALVSNVCQAYFGSGLLFGGMSGVIYGFLGFSWVAPLLQPRWRIQPARAIIALMVGWLVLCASGIVEQIGLGAIANWAHFTGLASGMLLGLLLGLLSRIDSDKPGAPAL